MQTRAKITQKSQAVTSNNQIAIDIGVGCDDTESSVLKKYFPIYSYVQQITDDDSLTLSINSNELYAMRKKLISDNRADQMLNEDEYNDWNSKEIQISEPFIYEYTEDTPIHCIRDYDNIETKEVLDIINSFFLLDDGGAFCELHYSTRRGNRNGTRVIISSDIGLVSCQKINGN